MNSTYVRIRIQYKIEVTDRDPLPAVFLTEESQGSYAHSVIETPFDMKVCT